MGSTPNASSTADSTSAAAGDPRWERTQSRRVGVTSIARELGAAPAAADVEAAVLEAFGVDPAGRAALTPAERAATKRLLADRYGVPAWHTGETVDGTR